MLKVPNDTAGPKVGCLRGSLATEDVTFIDNVKRLLGREYDSSLTHQLGYATAPLKGGGMGIQCQHTGRTLTVAEVSSEILKVR